MKTGKIISAILATACCLLVLCFSSQAFHSSKSPLKAEAQSPNLLSAELIGDNVAILQPVLEINFSFSSKKGFETEQYSLWAICQRVEYFFKVNSEYLKYSINYFIYHHKTSLIFPFHHFW